MIRSKCFDLFPNGYDVIDCESPSILDEFIKMPFHFRPSPFVLKRMKKKH